MPFGRQKKKPSTSGGATGKEADMNDRSNGSAPSAEQTTGSPPKSKLVFHCQQAHGSPTGIISGFSNVKELYSRIADAYDIEPSEVSSIGTPVMSITWRPLSVSVHGPQTQASAVWSTFVLIRTE